MPGPSCSPRYEIEGAVHQGKFSRCILRDQAPCDQHGRVGRPLAGDRERFVHDQGRGQVFGDMSVGGTAHRSLRRDGSAGSARAGGANALARNERAVCRRGGAGRSGHGRNDLVVRQVLRPRSRGYRTTKRPPPSASGPSGRQNTASLFGSPTRGPRLRSKTSRCGWAHFEPRRTHRGRASLELPGGIYALDAWKAGYEMRNRTVKVGKDRMIRVEAVVAPERDPDDERVWM